MSVVAQLRDFPCGNHSTPPPFNQGLLDNVAGGGFRRRQICDGSERASHGESLPGFDVLYIETKRNRFLLLSSHRHDSSP